MKFTPMDETKTERLSFELSDVHIISGDLSQRCSGLHAIVEIAGTRYEVHGLDCGLPCYCDAYIVKVE